MGGVWGPPGPHLRFYSPVCQEQEATRRRRRCRRRRQISFTATIRRQSLLAVRSESSTLTWFFQDDSTSAPCDITKGSDVATTGGEWTETNTLGVVGAVEDGLLKSATVRQSNTTEMTRDNIAHRTKQSNWNEAGRIKKGAWGLKDHTLLYECRTETRAGLKLSGVTWTFSAKIDQSLSSFFFFLVVMRGNSFIVSSVAH